MPTSRKDPDMSVATESNMAAGTNTAMPAIPAQRPGTNGPGAAGQTALPDPVLAPPWQETTLSPGHDLGGSALVEQAISAATSNASRIAELFDALRTARLWLPLPEDGPAVTPGGAVRLPTVVYLGSEFVAAYTSAELLTASAQRGTRTRDGDIPHAVARAADLARLLPPDIGIALNAGADQSVPIYPQGVTFLAADPDAAERGRVTVGPLPCQPDGLLAGIRAGLAGIPQARRAAAAWLSVQFSGEGVIISVTLDQPADPAAQDAVIAALTRAAEAAPHDVDWPLDVTFPGEGEPDDIDRWIAAFAEPFYSRD
jgi:SseB protein N-terminal domain